MLIICFFIPTSVIAQSPPSWFGFDCGTSHENIEEDTVFYSRGINTICTDTNAIVYIGVHWHFVQDTFGNGNFKLTSDGNGNINNNGFLRAEEIINLANYELANPDQMWRPSGNSTPIPDVNIRYVLLGVHFPKSTYYQQHTFFATRHTIANDLGIDISSTINVFDVTTNDGSGIASGITGTNSPPGSLHTLINIYGAYLESPEWINYPPSLFNHEAGHLLGLRHTWNENDNCDDTPLAYFNGTEYVQCWGYIDNHPVCSDWANISNNLMDYNAWFPKAITPCQRDRMYSRIHSSVNQYIHSCDGCPPVNAFFYAKDEACLSDVVIHAQASFNEDEHLIEICEVSGYGSNTCTGGYFNSGWLSGSADKFNLSSYLPYSFAKNKYYKVTLKVASTECPGVSEMSKIIKTKNQDSPCYDSVMPAVEIRTVYPNPSYGDLTVEYDILEPGIVRVDLVNSSMIAVQNLEFPTSKAPGTYSIYSDISSVSTGTYYVALYLDNQFYSRILLKL